MRPSHPKTSQERHLPCLTGWVCCSEMTLRDHTLQDGRQFLLLAFGVFLCLSLVAVHSLTEAQPPPQSNEPAPKWADGNLIASPLAPLGANCAPDNTGWESFGHFVG